MNPVMYALCGSYRLRAALAWLGHQRGAECLPLLLLGAVVGTGHHAPALMVAWAVPVTALIWAVRLLGTRLHRELDWAGVPCRWCEIDAHEAEEATR